MENTGTGSAQAEEQLPDGFVAVESSHIKAVAFFDGQYGAPPRVEIIFKRAKGPGARWAYHGVTREMHDEMMDKEKNPSVGKYFAARIKGNPAIASHMVVPTPAPTAE